LDILFSSLTYVGGEINTTGGLPSVYPIPELTPTVIAFTTPLLIVAVAIAIVVLPIPANPVPPMLIGCCIVTVGAVV
jgi:hypothetical protein